ncbi:MAG: hypothetical protein B7Z71_09510 [Acidocella sp. 21-58-7]|nr:MAG: hypothetical protein B7Z71_09510 [Acidocella sp. 21-58-7]
MVEDNKKFGSDGERLSFEAGEYWSSVAAKGQTGSSFSKYTSNGRRSRRQSRETEITNPPSPPAVVDPEETDPVILIIDALRKSSDANQAALAEARATRQDIAESDRKVKNLADTSVDNMRMVNTKIQNFTVNQTELNRAKSHNVYWGIGGFILGMVVLEAAMIAWQHLFG